MGIHRADAVRMRDRHEQPPPASAAPGPDHMARLGGDNGGAPRCREVDARVEAPAAWTETVPERPVQRRRKQDRRGGGRRSQRSEGRGTRDTVDGKARPALVASDRVLGMDTEPAVEDAEREAVPRQQELEYRYVPADVIEREDARAKPGPTQAPESRTRALVGYAVDRHACLALEPANGARRLRAGDTVDRAVVNAPGVQSDLQRRDGWVTGRRR